MRWSLWWARWGIWLQVEMEGRKVVSNGKMGVVRIWGKYSFMGKGDDEHEEDDKPEEEDLEKLGIIYSEMRNVDEQFWVDDEKFRN